MYDNPLLICLHWLFNQPHNQIEDMGPNLVQGHGSQSQLLVPPTASISEVQMWGDQYISSTRPSPLLQSEFLLPRPKVRQTGSSGRLH
jgi:hypothetical protein